MGAFVNFLKDVLTFLAIWAVLWLAFWGGYFLCGIYIGEFTWTGPVEKTVYIFKEDTRPIPAEWI